MIGYNTTQLEYEFFTMVYVVTVMQELFREKLLLVPNLPALIYQMSFDTLNDLSAKYPLPSYDTMAEYGYKMLQAYNPELSFTKDELRVLFLTAQVNNGYIL